MSYGAPGIYPKEIDFSFYVKQLSTSSCAMVGIAEKGEINKPGLVTSWEQFMKKYGGYIRDSYLAYAARAFFDNGGSVLYVNRIAHLADSTDRYSLTAIKSSVTMADLRQSTAILQSGSVGTDRVVWTSKQAGLSGNAISIELLASGNDTPLSVSVSDQCITVHLATDIDGNPTSTVSEVIIAIENDSAASALVSVSSDDSGTVQPMPATALTGGADASETLRIRAINEGSWGDQISVTIEAATDNPDTGFNLVVRYKGHPVEVYKNLSMDEAKANHVELLVNGKSDYITVDDLSPESGLPDDRPELGDYALAGGDDGIADIQNSDFVGDASQHTGFHAFDEINALNILLCPGITTATVINAGIAYAENRKDLIFVADAPMMLEPMEVLDFRKGQGAYTHGAFNTTYAALYYPWLEIEDPMTGKPKLVPPSGAVAGCYARNDKKAKVWNAPAGTDRGRILNVNSVGYKLSEAEMGVLYAEGINCIASFTDTGINIWGQRTLFGGASSLLEVAVRRSMMYMEESIAASSKFVVFQPNNSQTWRSLLRLINPFLQDIKDNGGLYDFAVQCDEETNTPAVIDRNEVIVRIFVKPTRTAEFVELNFILVSSGGNFSELLAA